MEKSLTSGDKKSKLSMYAKRGAMAVAGLSAAILGISGTFALDYDMSGPALNASAITGLKAGVGDSVATLQTTLNNQYLMEGLILFIGLSVGIGVIMFLAKGHRRI